MDAVIDTSIDELLKVSTGPCSWRRLSMFDIAVLNGYVQVELAVTETSTQPDMAPVPPHSVVLCSMRALAAEPASNSSATAPTPSTVFQGTSPSQLQQRTTVLRAQMAGGAIPRSSTSTSRTPCSPALLKRLGVSFPSRIGGQSFNLLSFFTRVLWIASILHRESPNWYVTAHSLFRCLCFFRAPCAKKGGMRFTINGNPWFVMILVTNCGGAGDVQQLQIRGSDTPWYPCVRNWGQMWQMTSDPNLPGKALSFRATLSDGSVAESLNAAPSNWGWGQTFEGVATY